MYFRQSLKRTKDDLSRTSDLLTARNTLGQGKKVSVFSRLTELDDSRSNAQLLAPLRDVVNGSTAKGCSPLIRHSYSYPPKMQAMLAEESHFRQAGYACGVCWLFCDNKIILWTAGKRDFGAGCLPTDEQWELCFPSDIVAVQIGHVNGLLHLGQAVLKVLAVALLGELRLFCFDGKKFDEMGVSLPMDEQVHQIVFTSCGNIIRAGSNGFVQMLVCNPRTRAFEERSSIDYWARMKMLLRPRQEISVQQLLMDNDRGVLYCLVSEVTNTTWLGRKLFGVNNGKRTKVVVYEVTDKQIRHRDEFYEQRLKEKLSTINLAGYGEPYEVYAFGQVEIVRMFLPQRGLLGLVLRNGMFVLLKNTSALEVEHISAFATNFQPKVLFEKLPPRGSPPMEIRQSLGLDNLAMSGGRIVYLGGSSVDVLDSMVPLEGQLVEVTDSTGWIRHSPFETNRSWLYFHSAGVELLTKYTPVDKLLVLLHIQLSRANILVEQPLYVLFNDLCETLGVVPFCCNLIEIICNPRLRVAITGELYESTVKRLEQLESSAQPPAVRPSVIKPTNQRSIIIDNNLKLRDAARQLLKHFDYRPVKTRLQEVTNIYIESLGSSIPATSDSLWCSVLLYFHSMYEPVRNRNINFFKGQTALLDEFLGRLDSFTGFLLNKEKDLCTDQYFLATPKRSPEEIEFDSFDMESTRHSLPKLKPQILPSTQDYPTNSTSLLLCNLVRLAQRTYLLIEVLRRLAFLNVPEEKEPTLHEMLTNKQAQAVLKNRIFKSFKMDDPLLLRIQQFMPEVISKEDVAFQKWLRAPEKIAPNVEQLVRILDMDRLERAKAAFFKTETYRPFYDLLLRRLKYLTEERKILDATAHRISLPGSGYRSLRDRQTELEELSRHSSINTDCRGKLLDYIVKELTMIVESVRKNPNPKDIRNLDDLLTAVYASDCADVLQRCLQTLNQHSMTAQSRYLRTHPSLATESAIPLVRTSWK